MKKHFLLLLASCLLPLSSLADEPEAPPPPSAPKLAYGLLVKQGDKILFAPCRDRSYALVEDVSPDKAVTRGLQQVGLDQGQKLYVELVGSVEGIALKASALNLARTNGRCQQPGGAEESWRAAGQMPGWLLAAGGDRVTLKREGQNEDRIWPHQEFQRDGDHVHFAAQAGNEQIELRFERKLCQDPAAEAVFGWTAQLKHNGQTLQGCAWQR
ncbi:hypothetical protein VX159_14650 [Dechloromonas sp. ZY10]|uniref:hypothetical protein n=1 Tax=Dechloromonas aquae TaxID=2664436 RepID=UPI0035287D3A